MKQSLWLIIVHLMNASCFLGSIKIATAKDPKKEEQGRSQRLHAIENLIAEFESRFTVRTIPASQLMDANGQPKENFVFVDVRSHGERQVSKIPGSLSWDDFRAKQTSLERSNKTIVLLCTIGYRSSVLAQRLAKEPMPHVNLRGGLLSWVHHGGTITDRHNKPTKNVHVYGSKWNVLPPDFVPTF